MEKCWRLKECMEFGFKRLIEDLMVQLLSLVICVCYENS